ncbi:hypothetical protein BR93DRAFT_741697 [Coniochaeta sp. PMI_546]|nr:hypothetical protein BR93DRAFT_741697 [Coniochaeta sp. PMI_546]
MPLDLSAAQDCWTDVVYEGYERTALRRQTINSLLGSSKLPPNFWSKVDILTSRILALLLPLLDLVDAHFPSSATNPLASIHADLHSLVAEAGFLAVSMRRSDTIFRLIWPSPGDLSDSSHSHDQACEVIYQVSKHAAEAIEKGIADVAAQDRARERGVPTPTAREQMPFWKRVMLVGKVKIVVWPGLERYRRLVEGGTEGVDEVVVRKAVVGYYCGRASGEANVAEGRPQLREYIRGIVERRREQRLGGRLARFVIGISLRMWLIVAVLLVSGIGVLLFPGSIGDGWGGLDGYPEGYPGVQSVTDLEQQDWTVESVLARFGRGMIADLFKGTFGGHGGGHEAV